MEELIEHLKTIDPKKVHGMVVSYVYKSEDKDDKGNEIYDLDTKMVGDSYTLLGINRGFQDALMHVLAEEAQANVLSNVEGVTKH